jgi:hypothetical protein
MEHSIKVKLAIKKAFKHLNGLPKDQFNKELEKYKPDPFFEQIAETLVQQPIRIPKTGTNVHKCGTDKG